jgi:hypothetical protein
MRLTSVNTRAVLISLFIATLLWGWVTLGKTYSFIIGMPLVVSELPEEKVMTKRLPDSVFVRLEGSGRAFMRLYFYEPAFRLNLSGLTSGQSVELRRRIDDIDFPASTGIRIIEIVTPKYIGVDFTERLTLRVPLRPLLDFSVEPGYLWVQTRILPDSVLVSGPRDLVSSLVELQTETIDLPYPLTRSETINAKIQLPEETNIWLERSQAQVKLDIQRLAQNRLSEVPIAVINVPPGQSATPVPQNLTVVLKGGDKILAGLNRDNLRAYINYRTDYVASEDRYRVNFNIGDQIEIVAYEPRYFDILLRKIER